MRKGGFCKGTAFLKLDKTTRVPAILHRIYLNTGRNDDSSKLVYLTETILQPFILFLFENSIRILDSNEKELENYRLKVK
jgi:hypothetical protein